jgi:GH25 family lysozyme M1 (1,4-beta-N-acetylmuramidase)
MSSPIFDDTWNFILAARAPETRMAMINTTGARGADTSSWQGSISWSPVAAFGIDFVYVKANEGTGTTYPTLDAQYQGAQAAGLATGLYSYCLPNLSPSDSADAFAVQINRLGAVEGHLPPALDIEEGVGDLSGWCQEFIARLRLQTGCQTVMLYSDISFLTNQLGGENWMDDDTLLWLADYSAQVGRPRYSSPRLAIHQYSQEGLIPGVSGDVDLNYALYPLSQLIVGEDMTPEQDQMLQDIHDKLPVIDWLYGQLAGPGPDGNPAPFPTVPGWQPFEGGTDKPLSALDYMREANVQLNTLTNAVQNAISNTAGTPANVDARVLADEIVAEFLTKLTALPPAEVPSV